MTVHLQDVADCVAELIVSDEAAEKLQERMISWQNDYHRSHSLLMRIPGFRRIWEALEEMCDFNLLGA